MLRIPKAIPSALLTATAAVYYQAPALTTATVNNLSLTNTNATGGAAVAVTMHRVPSGGTPGLANQILSAFSIVPGQTLVPNQAIGLQLEAGMTLQVLATVAGVVSLSGGVYETSGS